MTIFFPADVNWLNSLGLRTRKGAICKVTNLIRGFFNRVIHGKKRILFKFF